MNAFAILCPCVCLCVTVYFLNTIGHCFMNSDEKLLNVELIASQQMRAVTALTKHEIKR